MLRLFYGNYKKEGITEEKHILKKYLEPVTILETDVDDVSGEILGNFIKKLGSEDVLDVQIIASTTKKNRPGQIIKVLCRPEIKFGIIEKIIEELGTLGVRINTIDRVCVDRKIERKKLEINGKEFHIKYKISFIDFETRRKVVNIKPEYDDLKKISKTLGLSVKNIQVYTHSQIQQMYEDIKNTDCSDYYLSYGNISSQRQPYIGYCIENYCHCLFPGFVISTKVLYRRRNKRN